MIIKGKNLYIKELTIDDLDKEYLQWMNDKELTKFMESRWHDYNWDDLKNYVRTIQEDKWTFLFGIYLMDNDKHIGNIKIGPVDPIHRQGDIGFIIGSRDEWGKGYASESILLILRFAFYELKLNKVTAGFYEGNKGSYRCLIKNGFSLVGVYKKDRLFNNDFVDMYKMELLRENWNDKKYEIED